MAFTDCSSGGRDVLKDAFGALDALKASFSAPNALKASFSTRPAQQRRCVAALKE
ncbi:hypothetical protein [Amycolatopsis samaneae]|uniref:Uncharacterized protein n=1 Tax=Amycolatopsis samaneae TaxID=664691 RepID=A0ABW5GCR0_9PSEU